ncbi:MAG: hypothetical protein IPP01_00800 [Saprospiraceae bacterium]|nr:hypothetical protein [Saprospiraceae bacterium]
MKNSIHLISIIIICLVFEFNLSSQKMQQLGDGVHQFTYEQIISKWGVYSTSTKIQDTCFRPPICSKIGVLTSITDQLITKESALVIGMLKDSIQESVDFYAKAVLKVFFKRLTSSRIDSTTINLSIDYKTGKRQNYKAKDYIKLDSIYWAIVQLDSIISDKSYGELGTRRPFVLEFQILGKEYLVAKTNDSIQINIKNLESKGNYILKWKEKAWAQSYDLEWQFLDGYSNKTIEFQNNSTRINLPMYKLSYTVPIISAAGKFRCRIRAVGLNADGKVVNGKWSEIAEFDISNSQAFEKNKKPWQYTANYLDDGFRRDVVSFADVTGRSRQSNTKLNSGHNQILVQEDYYDHQGRPVVKSLVTPFQIATTTSTNTNNSSSPLGNIDRRFLPPGMNPERNTNFQNRQEVMKNLYSFLTSVSDLSYKPKFNQDKNGRAFDRRSFDIDLVDDCSAESKSLPMSDLSGSGKYYSPQNAAHPSEIHSNFEPDAEGYPYVQVEYTPDNTGRIRRKGMAGKDFQIGSGRESKYYYAVPSQQELYRVFGSEVGRASNYTKMITEDANNQLHVQYLNSKNQVIATALMGNTPENLESLPSEEIGSPIEDQMNLMEGNNIEYSGRRSTSSHLIFLELPMNVFNLSYVLNAAAIQKEICRQNICTNCPRNIIIRMVNSCGDTVCRVTRKIPGSMNCNSIASSSVVFTIDTTLNLPMGEYSIFKTVELDGNEIDSFITRFISIDTSCFSPTLQEPICITKEACIPCNYSISTIGEVKRKSENDPSCKRNCIAAKYSFDIKLFETLCRDVSPYGQYGSVIDSSRNFFVSVFNTRNILHPIVDFSILGAIDFTSKSYRDPRIVYLNDAGEKAWIDVTDVSPTYYDNRRDELLRTEAGRTFVTPNKIINLEYLSNIWKDSWSESLVSLHPEYPYLLWNNMNASGVEFDQNLQAMESWDDAVNAGILDERNLNLTLESDPFFRTVGNPVIDLMRNRMIHLNVTRSLYGDIFTLIKSTVSCNAPVHIEDPSSMRSCLSSASLISNYNDEGKKFAMSMFKSFYAMTKYKLLDSIREFQLSAGSGHVLSGRLLFPCLGANDSMSCASCPRSPRSLMDSILAERTLKVPHTRCINLSSVSSVKLPANLFNTETVTFNDFRFSKLIDCKITPKAEAFQYLLNAICYSTLAPEKLYSTKLRLNNVPPLVLIPSLIEGFPNRRSSNYYWKASPSIDFLAVEILDDDNRVQASFKIKPNRSLKKLKDVKHFNCITIHFIDTSARSPRFNLNFSAVNSEGHFNGVITDIVNIDFSYQAYQRALADFRNEIGAKEFKNLQSKKGPKGICCIMNISPEIKPVFPCEYSIPLLAQENLLAAKRIRSEFLRDSLWNSIARRCINPVLERFVVTKQSKIYHYTLFYYDQSGLLVKTVSPLAVRTINSRSDSDTIPNHVAELCTRYAYNSLGNKVSKSSADGGVTKYCYDEVNRPVMSQDAVQSVSGTHSYIIYDRLGRVQESAVLEGGIRDGNTAFEEGKITNTRLTTQIEDRKSRKVEIVVSYYDKPFFTEIESKFTNRNRFLRNRIASTASFGDYNTFQSNNYTHAFHFNYDISGNVTEIISDFKELNQSGLLDRVSSELHRFKKFQYAFYPFSGKVKEFAYQIGQADQYYQWYEYDADNRLVNVFSSKSNYEPADRIDRDAHYKYYTSGNSARAELGPENNQAMDLTYTLNGLLKSVNKIRGNDPGQDGEVSSTFSKDLLSYELHYYQNDYKPIKVVLDPITETSGLTNLYNGNISGISVANQIFGDNNVHKYRYDILGRLISARRNNTDQFSMNLSYDANGNIKNLQRRGATGNLFDNFTYDYLPQSNRLNYIDDRAGQNTIGDIQDLRAQSRGNYNYDAKGRLIQDRSENHRLEWNHTDKLKRIVQPGQTFDLSYDVLGRRSMKKSQNNQSEYTIRDFKGNVLAEYIIDAGRISLSSIPIYAENRLGVINLDTLLTENIDKRKWNQWRGAKVYELKNQVGDVNILFSDRKINEFGVFTPDIQKNTEYYPFGMIIPGRDSSYSVYRYGFQSMEQDDIFKGKGNSISTEFRQYDPRVSRWLSVDPKEEKYPSWSNYVAFDNNPVNLIDPKGAQSSPSAGSVTGQDNPMDGPCRFATAEECENVERMTTVMGMGRHGVYQGASMGLGALARSRFARAGQIIARAIRDATDRIERHFEDGSDEIWNRRLRESRIREADETPRPSSGQASDSSPTPNPRPDGPSPNPRPDGPSPNPRPDGPSPSPRPDGPSPDPRPDGPSPSPRPDGPSPDPRPDGPSPIPRPDGPSPDPRSDGPSHGPTPNPPSRPQSPRTANVPSDILLARMRVQVSRAFIHDGQRLPGTLIIQLQEDERTLENYRARRQ